MSSLNGLCWRDDCASVLLLARIEPSYLILKYSRINCFPVICLVSCSSSSWLMLTKHASMLLSEGFLACTNIMIWLVSGPYLILCLNTLWLCVANLFYLPTIFHQVLRVYLDGKLSRVSSTGLYKIVRCSIYCFDIFELSDVNSLEGHPYNLFMNSKRGKLTQMRLTV